MNKFVRFLASTAGRYIMTIVFAIIIWGVLFAIGNSGSDAGVIIFFVVLSIFVWKALNKIQPAMFLWMSWTGWFVYFFVKFFLSVLVGIFVAPFQIGKYIADHVSAAARNE